MESEKATRNGGAEVKAKTTADLVRELCEPLAVIRLRAQRKAAGDLAKLMGAPQKIYEALYAMPLVSQTDAAGDE